MTDPKKKHNGESLQRWRAAALDAQMTCSGLREALQQEMGRAHKAEAEVERLREQFAWRPIETFPKTEGCYLVWDSGSPFMADYLDGTWWMDSTVAFSLNPTHWMPLPEAPEEARSDG